MVLPGTAMTPMMQKIGLARDEEARPAILWSLEVFDELSSSLNMPQ